MAPTGIAICTICVGRKRCFPSCPNRAGGGAIAKRICRHWWPAVDLHSRRSISAAPVFPSSAGSSDDCWTNGAPTRPRAMIWTSFESAMPPGRSIGDCKWGHWVPGSSSKQPGISKAIRLSGQRRTCKRPRASARGLFSVTELRLLDYEGADHARFLVTRNRAVELVGTSSGSCGNLDLDGFARIGGYLDIEGIDHEVVLSRASVLKRDDNW